MYIVTGGAGFIGSCVLSFLSKVDGESPLIVDNLGTSEKWKNLVGNSYVDCISTSNFRDLINSKNSSLGKITAVIHMGACSSTTERDADYLLDNNYRYSKELCHWTLEQGARFIYASSAATYGDGSEGYDDSDELTLRNRPLNMYGYSKQMFDEWLLREKLQSKVVGLKFFNVYGPNEYHKGDQASVPLKQYPAAAKGESIKLFRSYLPEYGDGEQKRDFIYVKDCVKVINFFLKNEQVNGIFNLGTGIARSWNDLASAIFKAVGKDTKVDYVDMPEALRGKYQYFTEAKMDKLRAAGYKESFYSLEEGIEDYVTNYLADQSFL